MLPFHPLPSVFIIETVYNAVFGRSMFVLKGGVSKTQSPSETFPNYKFNYNVHFKVKFGEYIHTHKEHNNDMPSCTHGTISTRSSNNAG